MKWLCYARRHIVTGALGLALLVLPACGMMGDTPPPAPEYSPLVAYMIGHERGDSTTLDDPGFGPDLAVTMQESFESAGGQYCKRATVVAKEKQAEIVVICRKGDEPWQMAPRIWGG